MADTNGQKPQSSGSKFVITLLLHQSIGTIGAMLLAGMLTAIVFELPSPWGHTNATTVSRVLTGTPYFPVQIAVALLLGWLLSDLFGHKSMLWVWVLPYAWLVYGFARMPTVLGMTFEARFSHFFGWGCRVEDHCVDQTGVTLPFYVAVAYAIGAFLAQKLPVRSAVTRRNISGVPLIMGVLVLVDEIVVLTLRHKHPLTLVPEGWGWLLPPVLALDAGIGVCLIYFGIRMRRIHRDLAARDPVDA